MRTYQSSPVLKLRLQALNLPIRGSKVQLLPRLKRASAGKASKSKQRPGRPQRSQRTRPFVQTVHSARRPPSSPPLAASGMASPFGLSRPVDRNIEDKTLRVRTLILPYFFYLDLTCDQASLIFFVVACVASRGFRRVWKQRKTEERGFRYFACAENGARANKTTVEVGEGKKGNACGQTPKF